MDVAAAALYSMCANNYYMNIFVHCQSKKKRRQRSCWMQQVHKKRTLNTMEDIVSDLLFDPSKGFLRMAATDFELLLNRVEPFITKQNTILREAIPAKIRLAVTLHYLATGASYRKLKNLFKISSQIVSLIVSDCCTALVSVLKDLMKLPENENEWLQKENDFGDIFPHCLGAIDSKRIKTVVQKKSYTINSTSVLLVLVDRNFCFMFCDIASMDRSTTFRDSVLSEKLETIFLHLPPAAPLPEGDVNVPYVFVGDNAIPLKPNIMTPFPGEHSKGSMQQKFNHKLSSVRIVAENAFGVMSARFRVLRKPISVQPSKASIVVLTCALLHNFLIKSCNSASIYTPSGYTDTIVNGEIINQGTWRQDTVEGALMSMKSVAQCSEVTAVEVRNKFAEYFRDAN